MWRPKVFRPAWKYVGTNLIKIGVTAATVALCATWMVHLVASQGLPEGLGASRVESSAVLQAPDSQHAPNLVPMAVIVPVAIEDDSGSVAGHSEQANGDRTDIWRTDETAVESQDSGSAVTQYGDEPMTSFGTEATHPQDVTNRTSASKVVGDVDNDGDKDSNDRELVDKNGDDVVSAQEAGVLEDARVAAQDAAEHAFAAADGALPEDAAYRKARGQARQAAEAKGVDQGRC